MPDSFAARRSPADPAFLVKVLTLAAFGLAAYAVVALVLPPQSGPLALALVFEFHLFAAALAVLVPGALLARSRLLWLAVVVALVVAVGRFSSEWVSVPPAAAADFTVATWNLESGRRTGAEAVASLRLVDADVVALQELEPALSEAIVRDPELSSRYPYRYLVPDPTVLGLGILSRYPIEKATSARQPVILEIVVITPSGDVTLIDAHPLPGLIGFAAGEIPVTFNPEARNDDIGRIRAKIDRSLGDGERLVVVGDFNTSPTEPAYEMLAAGLHDAHVEAGEGPGWTWRSNMFSFLPFGLLRIDYQFAGGSVTPVSSSVDCGAKGDHCRLTAGYVIG